MTDAPTYSIRTVEDFLSVPPDRRDVCLREFGVWLKLMDGYARILGDLVTLPETFDWIDDDKGQAHVAFADAETGEEVFRSTSKIA